MSSRRRATARRFTSGGFGQKHSRFSFRRTIGRRYRNAMSGVPNGLRYDETEPWTWAATKRPPYLDRDRNRRRNRVARASRKANR